MKITYDLYKTDPEKDEKAEFARTGELTITPDMIKTMFNIYYPEKDINDLCVDWDSLTISNY